MAIGFFIKLGGRSGIPAGCHRGPQYRASAIDRPSQCGRSMAHSWRVARMAIGRFRKRGGRYGIPDGGRRGPQNRASAIDRPGGRSVDHFRWAAANAAGRFKRRRVPDQANVPSITGRPTSRIRHRPPAQCGRPIAHSWRLVEKAIGRIRKRRGRCGIPAGDYMGPRNRASAIDLTAQKGGRRVALGGRPK